MEGETVGQSGLTHTYIVAADIPKSWLTEIKEVLTVEEAYSEFETNPVFTHSHMSYNVFDTIWNITIENYKLSHEVGKEEDNEMFQQTLKKFEFREEATAYTKSEWVWFAALKYARGQS